MQPQQKIATLGGLREYMQRTVLAIGDGFDNPADDWDPVYVVQTPRGIEVIGFESGWFESGMSKDVLGEALRLRAADVYRYALLINGHGIDPVVTPIETLDEPACRELRIEQVEGNYEFLTLIVGDAEQEEAWLAKIEFDDNLIRSLGEWTKVDVEGRFAGLNEYMRGVR